MIASEIAEIDNELKIVEDIRNELDGTSDIIELAVEESDNEILQSLKRDLSLIESKIKKLELKTMLSAENDQCFCILTISAGTGGIDAQDWAEILAKMYTRYFNKRGDNYEIIDKLSGEEAGIKHITIIVSERYSYGRLKNEHGVHRLVRISPFSAKNTRETSFALVEVTPLIEDGEIQIPEKDLKIDTFRASGHGGQSVNTTDSAVRITHLPTKVSTTCQNERSQYQNKLTALKILRAKLFELKKIQTKEKLEDIKGETRKAAWGNQIRSYVLNPYRMVKDHRSGFQSADTENILSGELDQLIDFNLHYFSKEENK